MEQNILQLGLQHADTVTVAVAGASHQLSLLDFQGAELQQCGNMENGFKEVICSDDSPRDLNASSFKTMGWN